VRKMGFSFRDDLPKCQLEEMAVAPEISTVARNVPVLIVPGPKSTWAVRVESRCDAVGHLQPINRFFRQALGRLRVEAS
jgi:hypothetical protein